MALRTVVGFLPPTFSEACHSTFACTAFTLRQRKEACKKAHGPFRIESRGGPIALQGRRYKGAVKVQPIGSRTDTFQLIPRGSAPLCANQPGRCVFPPISDYYEDGTTPNDAFSFSMCGPGKSCTILLPDLWISPILSCRALTCDERATQLEPDG
jgi:hypothetical protein